MASFVWTSISIIADVIFFPFIQWRSLNKKGIDYLTTIAQVEIS